MSEEKGIICQNCLYWKPPKETRSKEGWYNMGVCSHHIIQCARPGLRAPYSTCSEHSTRSRQRYKNQKTKENC